MKLAHGSAWNVAVKDGSLTQATAAVLTQTAWTVSISRFALRYLEYWKQRRTLVLLNAVDPRILRDMGIDRSEVTSIIYGDAEGRRRCCTKNLAAPYEGRRRCDATERALIGDTTAGRRGPI
jgi:uncharacterized protein YjiS (DUF1127 family)